MTAGFVQLKIISSYNNEIININMNKVYKWKG